VIIAQPPADPTDHRVALATVVLAVLPDLIWINLPEAG
jgi:hypothetical protein